MRTQLVPLRQNDNSAKSLHSDRMIMFDTTCDMLHLSWPDKCIIDPNKEILDGDVYLTAILLSIAPRGSTDPNEIKLVRLNLNDQRAGCAFERLPVDRVPDDARLCLHRHLSLIPDKNTLDIEQCVVPYLQNLPSDCKYLLNLSFFLYMNPFTTVVNSSIVHASLGIIPASNKLLLPGEVINERFQTNFGFEGFELEAFVSDACLK